MSARSGWLAVSTLSAATVCAAGAFDVPAADRAQADLRSVESFAQIADATQRSAALFTEAGKVILHPRCVNCHPATDRPLQGDGGQPHEPPVRRGKYGHGVPALRCATCHTTANYDAVGLPGHSGWRVAPAAMAWEGRSLGQICAQLKDPAKNGCLLYTSPSPRD